MSGQHIAGRFVDLYEDFDIRLGIDTHSDCEAAFVILFGIDLDHHRFVWVYSHRRHDLIELKEVGNLSDGGGINRYMHLTWAVGQCIDIQHDGLCRSGDVYITCHGYVSVECICCIFRYVDGFHIIDTDGGIESEVAQVVPVYASFDPSCSVVVVA